MTAPNSEPLTRRTIASDGLRIAVFESARRGPTIVFVHGYPDTHAVWTPVIAHLCDRFYCVAYDVRGAGESGIPSRREGYHTTKLVADLVAVIDAVALDHPVHLVGHDWGSVQAWDAVILAGTDPRLRGRIASFTTISGPCLDHVGAVARDARRGGWRPKQEALRQLLHSWYIYAFHVPLLSDYVMRRHARRLLTSVGGGRGHRHFGPTLEDDAAHGLNLYRANVFRRHRLPGGATTNLPVQLVVPLRDKYVLPALTHVVHRFAPLTTRVEIDAGHWVLQSHPAELAGLIDAFVTRHQLGPP